MNVAHRPLVWDSEMLDLLTGTVEVADDATTRAADGEALAERILAAAPGDEVLTCIKLPASQPVALAALLRAGGTFIDSEQTFIHVHGVDVNADQIPGANLAAPQVQICTRYDGDAFADLVPDIVHSRFRRDPRIPAAHAEALWRASIRNHCDGRASLLAVALVDETPAGLIACIDDAYGRWMFLVGVRPSFRRRGLGADMVRAIIAAPGARPLHVEALAGNRVAVTLYGRQGFVLKQTRHIIHLWRDRC